MPEFVPSIVALTGCFCCKTHVYKHLSYIYLSRCFFESLDWNELWKYFVRGVLSLFRVLRGMVISSAVGCSSFIIHPPLFSDLGTHFIRPLLVTCWGWALSPNEVLCVKINSTELCSLSHRKPGTRSAKNNQSEQRKGFERNQSNVSVAQQPSYTEENSDGKYSHIMQTDQLITSTSSELMTGKKYSPEDYEEIIKDLKELNAKQATEVC